MFFIRHPYLSGVWVGVNLRMDTGRYKLKRDWSTCLKIVNHSRLKVAIIGGPI